MKKRVSGPQLATMALLAVAVAASAFLWSTRVAPRAANHSLGGPLLTPSAAAIDALLLNVRGASYRFDRLPAGGWTLGGALSDDLDPRAMAALVDSLEAAVAGPLLPGTEPGDRRYEFNGPEGVQLTVHRTDGSREDISFGVINPVAGTRYATGAGRRFCFTVPLALRDRVAALPDAVRARQLLPGVEPAGIERITIEGDGATRILERRDGRWWLDAPAGIAAFGPLAGQYNALYDDRRRQDDHGIWLEASPVAVRSLIYEVSELNVREFAPPERTDELSAAWGLAPAWRRVTLTGPGVRPALAGAGGEAGDAPVLAFGPPLDERFAPALRRGHVMVVDREAINTLSMPPEALIDLSALPVQAIAADVIELTYAGQPLLRGSRRGTPDDTDGRQAWLTDLPTADQWNNDEASRHGLVRDLVINLSRQPILTALPPRTSPDPLRDDGRVGVTLTFGSGSAARVLRWDLGWLREPVAGQASAQTAALWTPDTGRLVIIPDALLVNMRNAAELVAARR
ncbi:MAG: DUF4340 domain-containing protein [bacterium]|nr:DUF4340 domain-containing protein [bacterium]